MYFIDKIIFTIVFSVSLIFFLKKIKKIFRNTNLGVPFSIDPKSHKKRLLLVFKALFGISKMNSSKPFIVIFHSLIYFGFLLINIELIEIIIDGIFGTHRIMSFLGNFYNFLTYSLEWIGILVIISCIFFLSRRTLFRSPRLKHKDLNGFPKKDGIYILLLEIFIMSIFFIKNSIDFELMIINNDILASFPISSLIEFNFSGGTLFYLERFFWWVHIISILFFINYICYSKHLHIITVFPSIYYSRIEPLGELNNINSVTNEVKSILGLSSNSENYSEKIFGARDIFDLNKKQLINAYACTQCGRCSDVCPQTLTGKELSPRKIMISTRSRIESVSKNIDVNGKFLDDKNYLLDGFISRQEIWACNSCLACNYACPIYIEPFSIIMDIRRYIFLEESKAPKSFNDISNNMERNSSPWKISNRF